MNRSGWRSQLTAGLTALITCVDLLSLSTAPVWAAAGTVTEFPPKELAGGHYGRTGWRALVHGMRLSANWELYC
jgi:hypothetical protein